MKSKPITKTARQNSAGSTRTLLSAETSKTKAAHNRGRVEVPGLLRTGKPARREGVTTAEERVRELKLQLPEAPSPVGVYKPVLIAGKLAYASGHGPIRADGSFIKGCVGLDLDLAAAKAAARQTGLTMLASLRRVLGSLDRIDSVIKVFGMVNCTAEFKDHPQVINGFSELFAEIWGPENGIGARSAVGTNSLPANIAVEVEAVFALK